MVTKTAARPSFRCSECGQTAPRWVGRCTECQTWGSVAEIGAVTAQAVRPTAVTAPATPIGQIDVTAANARPTGVAELDRVLGGGLVPGSVVLLAGEPGVGKSTLLLDTAHRSSGPSHRSLIVTGEESTAQVRLRAGRTGALSPDLYLAAETDLGAILHHIDDVQPALLVIDSIQTMTHPEVEGSAGGVTQVRACAAALISVAKQRGIATVIVGHVTKDGSIAGPRVLEHLVDVVLSFEGDPHSTLRLVRAVKNRFGAADEVGCFELTDGGIVGLADPSGLFLSRRDEPVSGTCVTVTVEGRRPLLAEVQALVAPTALPAPRRASSGLDSARVGMVLAVLERRARVRLSARDVYTATVGGARLTEPATDLAVALAVASAACDTPISGGLVALGEVGLAGEIRRISAVARRLAEAARLGFTVGLVPEGSDAVAPAGMAVIEVRDIAGAVQAASRAASTRGQRKADRDDWPALDSA